MVAWFCGWTSHSAERTAESLAFGEDGLDEQSSYAGSLLTATDRGGHQVAVLDIDESSRRCDAFVGADTDDPVIIVDRDNDAPVEIDRVRVGSPFKQPADDVGDLA